jgi:hypothetical protein
MHTAALILALLVGAIGFSAYLGISTYSTWRMHQDASAALSGRALRLRKALYVALFAAAVAIAAISGGLFGVTLLGAVIAVMVVVFDAARTVGERIVRRWPRRR